MEAESGVAFPHLRTLHRPVADAPEPTEQGQHGHVHASPPAGSGIGSGAAARMGAAPLEAGLEAGLDAGLQASLQELQELAAVRASSRPLSLQELRHHTVCRKYVASRKKRAASVRSKK